ncbi:MAG: hypothetical protein GYA15_15185 [Leptolinea sp.]|jgi:hypothetical protein|nr:hypothetical protein [Leptolinea sp.]
MEVNNKNLEQSITELASQAVQAARDRYGVTLDFSMNSLNQFYLLIDQAHQVYLSSNVSPQGLDHTVEVWGAYLGETLRRNKRGVWKIDPEQTGDRRIYLTTSNVRIHPLEQVRIRITGEEPVRPELENPLEPPDVPKPKRNPLIKILIVIGALAILGLLAIPVLMFGQNMINSAIDRQHASLDAPFLPFMDEYLKAYPDPLGDDLDMQGRILILDINTRSVADLQYKLPANMRANNPDDLSIVVQRNCFATKTTRKSDTEIYASQMQCDLTLVDIHRGMVAATQSFQSGELKDPIRVNERGNPIDTPYAGFDPQLIINWLASRIP